MDEEINPLVSSATETVTNKEDVSAYPTWINEIVHTDQHRVFLHRTPKHLAQETLNTGFNASLDESSTTTRAGSTPETAFSDFKRIFHVPNQVVILHIPQRLFDELDQNQAEMQNKPPMGSILERSLSAKPTNLRLLLFKKFYNKDRDTVVIPKEWIYGYADQNTLELVSNPNYDPELRDPLQKK